MKDVSFLAGSVLILAPALLIVVMLLAGLAASYQPRPPKPVPSRLEKSCFYKGNALPCFILDEALSSTWDV